MHTFCVVSHPSDLLRKFSVHSLHHRAANIHNRITKQEKLIIFDMMSMLLGGQIPVINELVCEKTNNFGSDQV